jgi:hypothetical protein
VTNGLQKRIEIQEDQSCESKNKTEIGMFLYPAATLNGSCAHTATAFTFLAEWMPWPLEVGIPSLGEGTEGKTGQRTVEVGEAGDAGLPPWNTSPILPIARHKSM